MQNKLDLSNFSFRTLTNDRSSSLEIEVAYNRPQDVIDKLPLDKAKEELLEAANQHVRQGKLKYNNSVILAGGSYTKEKISIVVQFNNLQ